MTIIDILRANRWHAKWTDNVGWWWGNHPLRPFETSELLQIAEVWDEYAECLR